MLEIDGSMGGGQILRTAVGLSALTLAPFKITNIRKNRTNPGLRPQHLTGVTTAGEMCGAEIKGAHVDSTALEFIPKSHNFVSKKIDIGTAGSIPLFLQTLTPSMIFSDKPITLQVRGGTAGLGAPTIEYTNFVTFKNLCIMGIKMPAMEVLKQGFYPKGGGIVRVKFFPSKQLQSIRLFEHGEVQKIYGISIAGRLPSSVAERQASAAKDVFLDNGYECNMKWSNVESKSAGTSITVFAKCKETVVGADEIGRLGIRAERIGKYAAGCLINSINSGGAFDKYLSDQIIPLLALAKGRSEIRVEDITDHLRTNILVTEKMLDVKFELNEKEKVISVEGINYKLNCV